MGFRGSRVQIPPSRSQSEQAEWPARFVSRAAGLFSVAASPAARGSPVKSRCPDPNRAGPSGLLYLVLASALFPSPLRVRLAAVRSMSGCSAPANRTARPTCTERPALPRLRHPDRCGPEARLMRDPRRLCPHRGKRLDGLGPKGRLNFRAPLHSRFLLVRQRPVRVAIRSSPWQRHLPSSHRRQLAKSKGLPRNWATGSDAGRDLPGRRIVSRYRRAVCASTGLAGLNSLHRSFAITCDQRYT